MENEMSRSSHLELHAIDSQVLGPLDSVSLPSEPADIRNWFSSYLYESPELNTLDGFQDFDGSGETSLEEEKKVKSGESRIVGRVDNGLLAAGKGFSDGIVKCNESDELEYRKSAAVVTGSSESLSLSSEPPDIKNWFSSYLYKSPQLDTIDDSTISDYKEREDGELCNAQKSCRQNNKDVRDFIDVEKSIELPSQSRISDVVVKCTNLVKDTKLDNQSVYKDDHKVGPEPRSSILSQSTSEIVIEQMKPGQRTRNHNCGSVENLGHTNTGDKVYDTNLDCSLINRTSHKLLNLENDTGNGDRKSLCSWIASKDSDKDSLEKEDLHEIASPGTLDLTVVTDRSTGKENEEPGLLENGFISTRKKSRQESIGNATKGLGVKSEPLGNGVKPVVNREKGANPSRKVLSETSNFHSPNVQEITGKWCCPQKHKPNLGPPLKQLRLEQWVRRV